MGFYDHKQQKPCLLEERSSEKRIVEAEGRRKKLIGLLIIGSLIIAGVVGGWYILQPKNQLAPDFSLIDLNGSAFRLSDFRGRVVVIDFMATWCGPCWQEMPHYGTIWEKYEDKIVLISIDIDPQESEETLRSFAEEFPYATWIWARDTANLAQVYSVTAIPKTVIIDQDGYIRFTHRGVTDASTFIQEIDQLLS